MDDVRFDEQIVIEEVGWKSIVGVDASHAPGRQNDDPRTVRRDPVFDLGLASEIHHRAAWIAQQSARFALKPAHHGAAHHTMLTGDPDRLIGKVKERRRIFTFFVRAHCGRFETHP